MPLKVCSRLTSITHFCLSNQMETTKLKSSAVSVRSEDNPMLIVFWLIIFMFVSASCSQAKNSLS